MSARQQRRELKTIAENLHRIAGDIEAVAAPGRLGLRRLDKDVAAGALIAGGTTLFESAAAVLRSSKSATVADLEAAEVLEKTVSFYSERVLPSAESNTGGLRVLIR